MQKFILFLCLGLFSLITKGQVIEGDSLLNMAGLRIDSPVIIKFLSDLEIAPRSGVKYSSATKGIDATVQNDSLVSMQIYRTNSIYGSYPNKLPKGIEFGMSPGEVVKILGKPATEYRNTGYSEYVYGQHVMTCWFEKGQLNQLSISLK